MSTFTSSEYCSLSNTGYEGLFEHDRGTEQIIIKDNLLSDAIVAEARAKAEFLKGGYAERWIDIRSIQILTLKQNDIISFKGLNWIVKEISLDFKPPQLIQTIKGLRYE